jgi:glycosyltransferase involved in cell wall biosynthesis
MKRLIFLNRFFFPDHSATSQILSGLAFHLAECGREVHVVTSQQLYDDPSAGLPAREVIRGVHVHRVATTRFGRSTLSGRGVDYLSFYNSTWRALLVLAERDDILVVKTDPPLVSIIAMRAAKKRRAHLVNWLQDIYPEVAARLGVPLLNGPIGRGLSHLRDRSLRAAAANVVVGDRMAERLLSRGISPDRVHVIPNWSDDDKIFPLRHADNPLRREWGLEDRFVVAYSGNLGRAHEFDTVLSAAERLRAHPTVVFLFIGGGYQFDQLARCVNERGLDRIFRFVPYQDQSLLRRSLCVADVHWISLKPELEGLIVPSKFYGIAAAGRPIIAITDKDGEIARLVEQHGCGLVTAPGQADELAETIARLSTQAERVAEMGSRARAMLEAHFTRRQAFRRWRAVLEDVG